MVTQRARREKLPDRRNNFTHKFYINGQTVYMTVGLYPDGRPGEVFIDVNKAGTALRAWAGSTAKLMSLMLQYGVPVSELIGALVGDCSEPFGKVEVRGHPLVRESSGVLDAVVRIMAQDFLIMELNGGDDDDDEEEIVT